MKLRLLLLMSVFFVALIAGAQTDDESMMVFSFHAKGEGADITMDSTPEQVAEFILEDFDGMYSLYPGYVLSLRKMQTDKYGNHHVVYTQMQNGGNGGFQAILHFHPDGSLYYVNGKLALMQTAEAAKTKSYGTAATITAKEAAVIATGDTSSLASITLVNHKNKPHEAYKVLNQNTMHYVYVDIYSGEILFSVSLFRDYAPWDELHGTSATVMANISYNGLQSIDVMQTDNGYVLRDPKRNILTVDATDKLDNYSKRFPTTIEGQSALLTETSEDFVFTDKQQFLECEYTTSLNSITFMYYTWGSDKPGPVKVHAYYVDDDNEPLDDIIEIALSDTAWVREFNGYKLVYALDPPQILNLPEGNHRFKITWDGYNYTWKNLMSAGNKTEIPFVTDEIGAKKVSCTLNIGANVSQPALDVHWGIQQVYDMYHDYFDINGCDNKGTQIVNIVNPTNKMSVTEILPSNSFAMQSMVEDSHGVNSFMMVYGLGKTGKERCLTSLDITAHEYTHNVTEGCGNQLQYKDETGALDEAIADCMAMITEYYVTGQPSWEIGNDVEFSTNNMRSFSDPWFSGNVEGEISELNAQPKYYGGKYWVDYKTTDIDQGGVHTNSGVFNYLFYLLCEGASGITNEMDETNDIHPIGMDVMKDVIFHSMMYYNSGLCDYEEIADNLLVVIEDINGADTESAKEMQEKMLTAFSHVGMMSTVEPTGINTHCTADGVSQDSVTYDLNGLPVGNDYKGVVIKNGSKVVKK